MVLIKNDLDRLFKGSELRLSNKFHQLLCFDLSSLKKFLRERDVSRKPAANFDDVFPWLTSSRPFLVLVRAGKVL